MNWLKKMFFRFLFLFVIIKFSYSLRIYPRTNNYQFVLLPEQAKYVQLTPETQYLNNYSNQVHGSQKKYKKTDFFQDFQTNRNFSTNPILISQPQNKEKSETSQLNTINKRIHKIENLLETHSSNERDFIQIHEKLTRIETIIDKDSTQQIEVIKMLNGHLNKILDLISNNIKNQSITEIKTNVNEIQSDITKIESIVKDISTSVTKIESTSNEQKEPICEVIDSESLNNINQINLIFSIIFQNCEQIMSDISNSSCISQSQKQTNFKNFQMIQNINSRIKKMERENKDSKNYKSTLKDLASIQKFSEFVLNTIGDVFVDILDEQCSPIMEQENQKKNNNRQNNFIGSSIVERSINSQTSNSLGLNKSRLLYISSNKNNKKLIDIKV